MCIRDRVLTAIPSTNTTKHTFVSASAGAVISGGEYVHAFHASATDGLLRAVNTVQIANNSLGFTCSRDNHRGTHLYPRTTDPASGQSLGVEEVNSEAIVVNVGSGGGGGTGAVVSAKSADNKHKFVSATVGAAFTGGNYAHIFDAGSENTNAVSVQSGAENGNQKTPNGATYDAGTGILVLSFASNHGMSTGDVIRITDNSITFTCDRDKHLTEHLVQGMGIKYNNDTKIFNYSKYKSILKKFLTSHKTKIIFEPGRSIIGDTALLLTKV